MNKGILSIYTCIKTHRTLVKFIGLIFVILSIFINPFTIERTIIPDRNLQSITKISAILLFEVACFITGLVLYIVSCKNVRKIIYRLTISLTSIIISVIFIEIFLFIQWKLNPRRLDSNDKYYSFEMNKDLGYTLKANDTYHAVKKYINGSKLYDVVYSTDNYRRRKMSQASPSGSLSDSKHIVLFGCSFAFGEALNDNNTLQYYLGNNKSGYQVYNYAVHGYGPQQMLALLESNRLPKEIPSTKGIAIYVFLYNHLNRLILSTNSPWTYSFPYYVLTDKKDIVRNGNFNTESSLKTFLYTKYVDLYNRSNFLQLINLNFPIKIQDNDIYLLYKLIAKSKELYEQQFNGKFYVLIHPLAGKRTYQEKFLRLLRENNISVIETPIVADQKYIIQGDGHAKGLLNEELSSYLMTYLNL